MFGREWGTGASIGGLVVFDSEQSLQRVGSCWMAGRVKVGDVALCISHSGDCFYNYILVEIGGNFIRGLPGSEFGAYVFGRPIKSWTPTDREHHLLCAGESIIFKGEVLTNTVPFIRELDEIKEAAQRQAVEHHTTNGMAARGNGKIKNRNAVTARPKAAKRGLRHA